MSSTDTNSGYLACRLIGLLGTGFASGVFLSTAYFSMPGLLRTKDASGKVVAFKETSSRSQALLNRTVFPSAISLIYAAIQAPSHPEDWINPTTLLGVAATTVTFTLPYSYFKLSRATKSLTAAGQAVEIDEEKQLGLSVVDDGIVHNDMMTWVGGEATKGWLVLSGFVLAAVVEVYYL
ncbi:hypothetical protein TWF730_004672 [Orbilia blumenaviensis]|uniref:DUF1772-domain-containing protein n=1 Tax=Orbilia blumenaviensis TaxID=1796055 RepID=A0AAV9TY70_9PEZI